MFAHGAHELQQRSQPRLYKTQLCKKFVENGGHCRYDRRVRNRSLGDRLPPKIKLPKSKLVETRLTALSLIVLRVRTMPAFTGIGRTILLRMNLRRPQIRSLANIDVT